MDFKLEFNMDNAAFEKHPEVEIDRIFQVIADQISLGAKESLITCGYIRDINNNCIGNFRISK